jgi:hypothetical protein
MSALRACRAFALCIAMASAVLLAAPAMAGVYGTGLFQLGDGQDPAGFAGAARIENAGQGGAPDWADLFDADGSVRPGVHGAVFLADDVSLGSGFESSALAGAENLVRNGTASAANDIGNAYAYVTRDAAGHIVLFVGVERLSAGDSFVELELNQSLVRLGHGGFGHNSPWKILGDRAGGDVIVRLDFAGGALAGVSFYRVDGDGWQVAAGVAGEGCNDAETLCAITNASSIAPGPWGTGVLDAGHFVEVGVDIGTLLEANPNFKSLRFRTPEDIAFGYFSGGN